MAVKSHLTESENWLFLSSCADSWSFSSPVQSAEHICISFFTHPKVCQQWCVCVGQHGVAGTQSLHSKSRSGRVGQSLSWGVLLVVVRRRPGHGGGLQPRTGDRRRRFPPRTLQPSVSSCGRRLGRGSAGNITAKDTWRTRSIRHVGTASRGTCSSPVRLLPCVNDGWLLCEATSWKTQISSMRLTCQ